jgi:hypothetical protein
MNNAPSNAVRPPANYLRAVLAIAWKDLAAELRSRELLSAMLVFSMLVLLIFYFALELDVKARSGITAGALWVTFAFAGTLGLNDGCGEGSWLSRWSFTCPSRPLGHLFWKSDQQPGIYAGCGGHRPAGLQHYV